MSKEEGGGGHLFVPDRSLCPHFPPPPLDAPQTSFDPKTGFGGSGFGRRGWFRDDPPKEEEEPSPVSSAAPKVHYGAEGPQGFLYHCFVQRPALARKEAAAKEEEEEGIRGGGGGEAEGGGVNGGGGGGDEVRGGGGLGLPPLLPVGIPGFGAAELDRCVWNYQKEGLAKGPFPCGGYSQRPLLVHKVDSRARKHIADVKRREGIADDDAAAAG